MGRVHAGVLAQATVDNPPPLGSGGLCVLLLFLLFFSVLNMAKQIFPFYTLHDEQSQKGSACHVALLHVICETSMFTIIMYFE